MTRTMERDFFIEVNSQQRNHYGERICGDVFISKNVREENRIVAVLSDGMGHGVKANILATLTSTMALNFTREHKEPDRIAEIIMNTLPVCSVRKISYATFTIVDIESDGRTNILEYDNPQCIILREISHLTLTGSKWFSIRERMQGRSFANALFILQRKTG